MGYMKEIEQLQTEIQWMESRIQALQENQAVEAEKNVLYVFPFSNHHQISQFRDYTGKLIEFHNIDFMESVAKYAPVSKEEEIVFDYLLSGLSVISLGNRCASRYSFLLLMSSVDDATEYAHSRVFTTRQILFDLAHLAL
jgi:hypothetical protein